MELCSQELCTGCMACYNACNHNAIKLLADKEGFLRPQIDTNYCVNCGQCSSSCPILTEKNLYGRIPTSVYATWAQDKSTVLKSSSGGVFTLMANYVLKQHGVIFGAKFDEKTKSVIHVQIESLDQLYLLQGSKYVQSCVGKTYSSCRSHLKQGRKVLFVGTPCQIAGLLSYLKGKYIENLYTVDLVCHGVPSPMIFSKYLSYLENVYQSQVANFNFRDKRWSWNRFNVKCSFQNGKVYYGTWEEDPYLRGFLRELFLRPSCHNCKFSEPRRYSDITLGDFWGFKERQKEKMNLDKGVSLVLVNTEKGENIFRASEGKAVCYSRDYKDAIDTQQALRKCFPPSPLREKFWGDYNKMSFVYLLNKYCYPNALPFTKKIKYRIGHLAVYKVFIDLIKMIKHKINNHV